MSDLKHRTPDQLRQLIGWCENKRCELREKRDANEATIALLQAENEKLGHSIHNIGQKESWARIWLARKT